MNDTGVTTPMKKVRGLGAAHGGTHHWWMQRLTALALIPLSLWFIYTLMSIVVTGDHEAVVKWLASSWNAMLMVALLLAMFYHAKLGLQVIIEDYVHGHVAKTALLILNAFGMIALTLISVFAVVKLHFLDVLAVGV